MRDEGLVEVIESLVKHVVEAIYGRIRTHHASKDCTCVCVKVYDGDGFIYIVGNWKIKEKEMIIQLKLLGAIMSVSYTIPWRR